MSSRWAGWRWAFSLVASSPGSERGGHARARAAERALRGREVELEDLRRKVKEAEIAEARQKAAPTLPSTPKPNLPAPASSATH